MSVCTYCLSLILLFICIAMHNAWKDTLVWRISTLYNLARLFSYFVSLEEYQVSSVPNSWTVFRRHLVEVLISVFVILHSSSITTQFIIHNHHPISHLTSHNLSIIFHIPCKSDYRVSCYSWRQKWSVTCKMMQVVFCSTVLSVNVIIILIFSINGIICDQKGESGGYITQKSIYLMICKSYISLSSSRNYILFCQCACH
jgi:hypothetical protein